MDIKNKKYFPIIETKSGAICLWEKGGSLSDDIGSSQIITGKNFEKLNAKFINKNSKSCGKHALIPIEVGCYIFEGIYHAPDYILFVYKVTNTSGILAVGELFGSCILTTNMDKSLFNLSDNENFNAAFDAALDKAQEKMCKKVYYAIQPINKKVINHKENKRTNDKSKIELIEGVVVKQFGGFKCE